MDFTPSRFGGAVVAAPVGRLDHASADSFQAAVQAQIAACVGEGVPLILDFSGVNYISSVGLRALMLIGRQVKASGSKVGVACLQPLVKEVFTIARFHLIVPCFDDLEAAAAGLH